MATFKQIKPHEHQQMMETINKMKDRATSSLVAGCSCVSMGAVAVVIATINACRDEAGLAVICALSGVFSAFIGAWNIKNSFVCNKELNSIEKMLNKQR